MYIWYTEEFPRKPRIATTGWSSSSWTRQAQLKRVTLVPDLQFVDPTWDGTAFVPFWGRELDVSIEPDDVEITPRQIEILRAILTHTGDLRPGFERALFDYYQAEIDGLYCEYGPNARPIPGTGPPKLKKPSQVWKLIDDPVAASPLTTSELRRHLSLSCPSIASGIGSTASGCCIGIGNPWSSVVGISTGAAISLRSGHPCRESVKN